MPHVVHKLAGEYANVFELCGIFGRYDEAEVMAVIAATCRKGIAICAIGPCIKQACVFAIAANAVALQIAYVPGEGGCSEAGSFVPNHTGFYDDAPVGEARPGR